MEICLRLNDLQVIFLRKTNIIPTSEPTDIKPSDDKVSTNSLLKHSKTKCGWV